ncbi:MAG: hypothetical protein AB8H80_08175 [Planctomycetota bacterium]
MNDLPGGEREQLLAALMVGERTVDDPDVRRLFDSNPGAREEWRRMREFAAQMEELEDVGDDLRSASAGMDGDGPKLDMEGLVARDCAHRRLRGMAADDLVPTDRAASKLLPSRRRWAVFAAMAAAAASLMIVLVLRAGGAVDSDAERDGPRLGTVDAMELEPNGVAFDPAAGFVWKPVPETVVYRIDLRPESEGPKRTLPDRFTQTRWLPNNAQLQQLPVAAFRWRVRAVGDDGVVLQTSGWASSSRTP